MKNRRNFIKTSFFGAGALAMSPYISAADMKRPVGAPKRFIFVRFSNGLFPDKIVPPTMPDNLKAKEESRQAFEMDLDKHELPDYLKSLDDYKEHMTIIQGMSARMSENGHASHQSVMGLFRSGYDTINMLKRTTVDFELAKLSPSPLGHVELSLAKQRHGIVTGFSCPAPYQRNFCFADPITAYENLFQCVLDPKSLATNNDMFSNIKEDELARSLKRKGVDKNVYENQATTFAKVQQRNKDLLKKASIVAKHMPDRDLIYSNGQRTDVMTSRQDMMTEIAASILTSGLTNVLEYTIDDLNSRYTGLPGVESHTIGIHRVGHNQGYGGLTAVEIRKEMRLQQIKQVKTLIKKLKAQPEGNGNMFDNTMIMYFPEGGERHHSLGHESPWVVMSGKNCNLDIAGRYIRFPFIGNEGHKTLGNWYTTLLNAHGNDIKHYGDMDATMTMKKLPQEGAIKRFMKA